ncbi:MAG: T9SS type A sorting domain-containing protein [Bacteroidetes bacterium]|nr:T9SS type A sorting domain-containing protein [Bacteroidota bacterium]
MRPDSNGTYSVVVTDSNGCMDTAKFVFIRTGIQEISTKPILKIYPNPTHSILNVETNATNYQIKIINTLGMKIYAETNAKEINTSLLPKGVYLLLVTTSDGNVASKVFMKE